MQRKTQRTYRKKPVAVFENGTRIYAPSASEPRYRVVAPAVDGRTFTRCDDEETARRHARDVDGALTYRCSSRRPRPRRSRN